MKKLVMAAIATLSIGAAAQGQDYGAPQTTLRFGNVEYRYDGRGGVGTTMRSGNMEFHTDPYGRTGTTIRSGSVQFDYGATPYRPLPLPPTRYGYPARYYYGW